MSIKYMEPLTEHFDVRGWEVVRTTPERSLYMFLNKYVDLAVVSSVAAASLSLEPCFKCPAIYGSGPIENVKLKFLRRGNKVKLWVTPQSYTGRALAVWFLTNRGMDFAFVEDPKNADALVLIGDEARELGGDVVDLGEAWEEAFGRPLVYAVTVSHVPFQLEVRYSWRNIRLAPLEEVLDAYLHTVSTLKNYWIRPAVPPKGLLGLLRSL